MQSANFYFADGKPKIWRRQVRRWPSAKFMSDKRQNKILPSANFYFLNGKSDSRRQMGLSQSGQGLPGLQAAARCMLKIIFYSEMYKSFCRGDDIVAGIWYIQH
ncbi:MAG TPA: hypothetical protein IAA30_02075 [Candidatus Treponema faecavium]|nr:hypothetical protein [Candidatus Treponema faecavium]